MHDDQSTQRETGSEAEGYKLQENKRINVTNKLVFINVSMIYINLTNELLFAHTMTEAPSEELH